jgi:hypothetical protein
MSDLSRTVPQEQLVSQDLQHLSPTPVINLGHLSLDDSVTRSGVINQIARACHDLGYFQVRCLIKTNTVLQFFRFPFCHFPLFPFSDWYPFHSHP